MKKVKTDAISVGLVKYLGTPMDYMKEAVEIMEQMSKLKDKDEKDLTEKDKKILQRSSELVILIETSKTLYF